MSTSIQGQTKNLNSTPRCQTHQKSSLLIFATLLSILFSITLVLIPSASLAASSTNSKGSVASSNSSIEVVPSTAAKTIAITQIVEHPALDEVREGIKKSLKEHGFEEGNNLTILYGNAQGNIALSSQIATKLLSQNLDVGIAISTPSAQSLFYTAKRSHKYVPIVFTAVSDPQAAKLESGESDYPITGIADTPNLEALMEVIDKLLPNLKTLGLMYNPSETNSVSTINRLKKLLSERGIKVREATVNNTNEVTSATQSLVGKVDALYFPQDNTIVSAIESVVKVTQTSNPPLPLILPIFTNDPVLVKKGVMAAVGYDYSDMGYETGAVIVEILNGKPANAIPIHKPKLVKSVINKGLVEKLKLTIPQEFKHSKLEVLN